MINCGKYLLFFIIDTHIIFTFQKPDYGVYFSWIREDFAILQPWSNYGEYNFTLLLYYFSSIYYTHWFIFIFCYLSPTMTVLSFYLQDFLSFSSTLTFLCLVYMCFVVSVIWFIIRYRAKAGHRVAQRHSALGIDY